MKNNIWMNYGLLQGGCEGPDSKMDFNPKEPVLEILVIYLSYCRVPLIFLKHCRENVSFAEPYVGLIKMKTCNPTKFSQPIGKYISHSYWKQIYCLKVRFWSICLNSAIITYIQRKKLQNMFNINNGSTRCCSGVFIINFEHIWCVVPAFFCWLWTSKCQMEYFIALVQIYLWVS